MVLIPDGPIEMKWTTLTSSGSGLQTPNASAYNKPPGSESTSTERHLHSVSSLYGTGSVYCWLLIICSVLVSWTLNRKLTSRDTITNDFIAALTLPAVAAGHLIYQLAHYPGDRRTILTTLDPALLPRVAAIEASLCACETFCAFTIPLYVVAASKYQYKRCVAVNVLGFLCFGVEVAFFILSPHAHTDTTNLNRPFVLNERTAMIPAIALSGILSVVKLVNLLWRLIKPWLAKVRGQPLGNAYSAVLLSDLQAARDRGKRDLLTQLNFWIARQEHQDAAALLASSWVFVLISPLAVAAVIGIPLGAFGTTPSQADTSLVERMSFFIPQSNNGLDQLDQRVALAGGLVTLISVARMLGSLRTAAKTMWTTEWMR